jgi:integrase
MIMGVLSVGFSRKRQGATGRPRYTAYYRDVSGRARSAGSFSNRKDADRAWQSVEAMRAAGRPGDPRAGRMTFRSYVEDSWLPNHVLEPSTREGYGYRLRRNLMPAFGQMRMSDILPIHVRAWVTDCVKEGMSPAGIRHNKIILSAIFTTALNDFIIALHPCRGVKSPTVPVKEYRIITPEEFELLQSSMPSKAARLLLEVAIGSGLRWGELVELRPRDLHRASGIVTVTRTVNEVNPKYHPDGGRFLVKPYPKSKRSRRFKLDGPVLEELREHIAVHNIGNGDLIFEFRQFVAPTHQPVRLVEATRLGKTEPNANGFSYPHGSLSAYTAGKCRCEHCRLSFAAYRARRRETGIDNPRGHRTRDSDGHVPRDWFRTKVWLPAMQASGIEPVRMHDLRHAHASWLLAGGADLQVVKERLGHASIATTGKYLHTLPTADETALAALRRTRGREG